MVQFTGSGGFAAFGGTRTVSLGGGSINWSAANFIATGQTLILGSAVADGTVDWQQAISMAGQARTVQVNNGSATVDAIMSAAIGGGSSGVANGFTKTGTGTLAFTSNLNSYWGPTTVSNGTLTVGNGSTNGILSSNSATISVASGATLAVNRSNDVSQAVAGGLGNGAAVISGDGGFTQAGGGITTLTLTNTYLGATTVSNGTLRLGASNVLANTNVTIAAATLDVGAGFTDTVGTLDVTAAATINLGDSSSKLVFANSNLVDWTDTYPDGTLNITGAFVSGSSIKFATSVGLSAGQLASITLNGSPATFSLDGSGFLVSGGGPVGFAAWQAANGTLGDRSDDHDNDGVDNGTEHFIHGTVANSGFTALPGVDEALDGTLSVTWTKAATYTGSYPTHYVVETSTTLAGPWTIETSPGNVSFPSANEVKYTFPGGPGYSGKIFARLKVTGP